MGQGRVGKKGQLVDPRERGKLHQTPVGPRLFGLSESVVKNPMHLFRTATIGTKASIIKTGVETILD